MKMKLVILCILFFCYSEVFTQTTSKKYAIRTVAFYNLENLFDTINDPTIFDEASPIMELKVNRSKVYWNKIDQLGQVISQIGKDKAKTAPVVVGVCEAENRAVLEDLVKSESLRKYNYDIIHYNSPDKRGIDVALLYQKRYFNPIHHQVFNPNIYRGNRKVYTRDQLLVSGYLDNEMIHLIVNHWPSRSGGEYKSNPLREKAAYQNTRIIEQIRSKEKNPKILIMGDFNDDPINKSMKEVLRTKSNKKDVKDKDLYNPYEQLFHRGNHTLVHNDHLNLFDMILTTGNFIHKGEDDNSSYKLYQANIFNKNFLKDKKGRYKGYPFRSFSNGTYTGGYSDHFPVYIYLIRPLNK